MLRSRSSNAAQRSSESSPIPLGSSDTISTAKSAKRNKKNNCLILIQLTIIIGLGCYGAKGFLDSQRLNEQLTLKLKNSEMEWKAKLDEASLAQYKMEELLNKELEDNENKWKSNLKKVTSDYEEAQRENERLLKEKGNNPVEAKLKKQIDSLRRSALRTQQQLQKLDKQAVLEKFVIPMLFVMICSFYFHSVELLFILISFFQFTCVSNHHQIR